MSSYRGVCHRRNFGAGSKNATARRSSSAATPPCTLPAAAACGLAAPSGRSRRPPCPPRARPGGGPAPRAPRRAACPHGAPRVYKLPGSLCQAYAVRAREANVIGKQRALRVPVVVCRRCESECIDRPHRKTRPSSSSADTPKPRACSNPTSSRNSRQASRACRLGSW